MTDPDLTDAEVALILGKTKRTIQWWAQTGRLPGAHKVGRAWRIPQEAAEAASGGEIAALRSGLEQAARACERLRGDVNRAAGGYRRWGRQPDDRDWEAVSGDVARIERALAGIRQEVSRYSA